MCKQCGMLTKSHSSALAPCSSNTRTTCECFLSAATKAAVSPRCYGDDTAMVRGQVILRESTQGQAKLAMSTLFTTCTLAPARRRVAMVVVCPREAASSNAVLPWRSVASSLAPPLARAATASEAPARAACMRAVCPACITEESSEMCVCVCESPTQYC